MSATDELRALLDDAGVEWRDVSDEYEWYTEWVPEMLVKHHHRHRTEPVGFFESTWRKQGEMANGLVLFGNKHHRHCIYDLTPKQAIAATLGVTDAKPTQAESSGTCHKLPASGDKTCIVRHTPRISRWSVATGDVASAAASASRALDIAWAVGEGW